MRRVLLCAAAAAMVMAAGPAAAQAPRAAQASLRVGISSVDAAARAAARTGSASVPGPRIAVPPDTLRHGVSGAEIVLGIAGSAAGMWGGALAGLGVYTLTSGCTSGCGDGGLGEGVIGLTVGSIVGTALGTHLGAKAAHRRTGSFGHRLMGAGVGFLAGVGAFAIFGNSAHNALPLIAFPVAQGVVGALIGHQE